MRGFISVLSILFLIHFLIVPFTVSAGLDCEFGTVEVEVLPCGDGGYFKVNIDFDYANVGNEGFKIQGNGNDYGDFNYEDLPVTISNLLGDGTTEYEFVVTDNQFEDCSNWAGIDPVDCGVGDCYISELNIDDYPCEEGQYNVYLNFEYEDVSEEGFRLFVNEDLFDEFDYADLPLNIGPFIGDGEAEYLFVVRDIISEDCASDKWFGPIDCGETGCNIWDMEATILPCNEESEFNVLINFLYENTGDDGFAIRGNGNNYGSYEYNELPVELGPFLADGETEYEFEARDNQLEGCLDWTSIDPFDCDTAVQIDNLNLNMVDCEGNNYFLVVDFDYLNEGEDGFIISGNGLKPTTFDYDELPVTVGPLTNDEITSYYFTLRDGKKVHFGNWGRFLPFNCDNLGLSNQPISKDIVNVFPNPASQKVWIKNHHSETVEVVIYNQSGAVLFKDISLSANETRQLQFGTAGLYFFQAIGSSSFENGKIFITR